ncbi:flagellar hook-basal body complex protein FliE [Edaphobacter bradus]|uniref:flagellar hook-basal body complex protein FliE n=1 Tax=Edaphobacter bradus TaxID=2259016 RepID=UPI0021DF6BEC|nr:flagellar hook-basal body complex protein FliE [Edaphobacter bradus]
MSAGITGNLSSSPASAGHSVASAGTSREASGGVPFAGFFRSMVEQTSALDQQASQAVTGLLSGQGVEIHDAMIATQKADMAFELALQVRNKAVAAYQQMMGMQF